MITICSRVLGVVLALAGGSAGAAPGGDPAAAGQAPGGLYEVQAHLKAVAPATARAAVVARMGERTIVAVAPGEPASRMLRPGTVVRHRLTDELAYYSGRMVVLLNDRGTASALRERFGVSIVKTAGDGRLLVLQAGDAADLAALRSRLQASGLVREVRLDLVGPRYQAN